MVVAIYAEFVCMCVCVWFYAYVCSTWGSMEEALKMPSSGGP